MGITMKEKDHWKNQIETKINQTIDDRELGENPRFRQKMEEEAEEKAWQSLGLEKLKAEREKVEDEIACREQTRKEILVKILKKLGHRNPDPYCPGGYLPSEVKTAVKRAARVHNRELMENSVFGSWILKLQKERDELLDKVWLATSPDQIREIRSRLVELLNCEPTKIQQDATTILPATES